MTRNIVERLTCVSRLCFQRIFVVLALASGVSAHVKWFCSYDVTKPTKPLLAVIDPHFLSILAAFVAVIFAVFCADGWVLQRFPHLGESNSNSTALPEKLMRLGTGAFFLCTWTIGQNILTPELHTKTTWIFGVQFLTAVCTAWRKTCVVSAAGICLLYAYGIDQYGFFHMLDYVYFLGMAAYLALISFSDGSMSRLRTPVMTGCLAFSLMWTAIEKLVYPQWSHQLMAKHGHMMMGLPFDIFIVIAAFVEFTLAFYLATGRGMLRLGALALLLVFISAMPEFGPLDIVGHFPLIAILSVPFLSGSSSLQQFGRLPRFGIVANAAAACLLYAIALSVFLFLYGSVQRLEYGS